MADCTGLENRCAPVVSSCNSETSNNGESDWALCLALLARKAPDLALVIQRWSSLPEAVQTGILAMIRAS